MALTEIELLESIHSMVKAQGKIVVSLQPVLRPDKYQTAEAAQESQTLQELIIRVNAFDKRIHALEDGPSAFILSMGEAFGKLRDRMEAIANSLDIHILSTGDAIEKLGAKVDATANSLNTATGTIHDLESGALAYGRALRKEYKDDIEKLKKALGFQEVITPGLSANTQAGEVSDKLDVAKFGFAANKAADDTGYELEDKGFRLKSNSGTATPEPDPPTDFSEPTSGLRNG